MKSLYPSIYLSIYALFLSRILCALTVLPQCHRMCTLQVDYEQYSSINADCVLSGQNVIFSFVEMSEIKNRVQIFAKIKMHTLGFYIVKGPFFCNSRSSQMG